MFGLARGELHGELESGSTGAGEAVKLLDDVGSRPVEFLKVVLVHDDHLGAHFERDDAGGGFADAVADAEVWFVAGDIEANGGSRLILAEVSTFDRLNVRDEDAELLPVFTHGVWMVDEPVEEFLVAGEHFSPARVIGDRFLKDFDDAFSVGTDDFVKGNVGSIGWGFLFFFGSNDESRGGGAGGAFIDERLLERVRGFFGEGERRGDVD